MKSTKLCLVSATAGLIGLFANSALANLMPGEPAGAVDPNFTFRELPDSSGVELYSFNLGVDVVAGDVILFEPGKATLADLLDPFNSDRSHWSDVLRFGNVSTVPSAGITQKAFLISDPGETGFDPTFAVSANVTFVIEAGTVLNPEGIDLETTYAPSGGNTYHIFSDVSSVPDGGLTVALLGFALVGVEGLRRKFAK